MSINVTVSGNPISIKRGKMVTADPDYSKKEFDKRRLMRLEQVRQQSKDIAEDVRNKVRKEKYKQMGDIENEGKQKLKNWQNRKLLELQSQYKEALHELGMGHKAAASLENEADFIREQQEINEEIARRRGCEAATKMQIDKNEKNYQKAKPLQQKKLARDIENTRASLVTNLKKGVRKSPAKRRKKRGKASADINISIPEDTDTENEVPDSTSESEVEGNLSDIPEESANSSDASSESEEPREPFQLIDDNTPDEPDKKYNKFKKATKRSHQYYEKPTKSKKSPKSDRVSPRKIQEYIKKRTQTAEDVKRDQFNAPHNTRTSKAYHKYDTEFKESAILKSNQLNFNQESTERNFGAPLDTRISDRIKRREFMASQPDFCDTAIAVEEIPYTNSSKLREHIYANRPIPTYEFNSESSDSFQDKSCGCGPEKCTRCAKTSKQPSINQIHSEEVPIKPVPFKQSVSSRSNSEEIPFKPPVKLRDRSQQTSKTILPEAAAGNKVQYYDHQNRFFKEKSHPLGSFVEKITQDSIEVIPHLVSEAENVEKMKQRDREARKRGQKALEKEKIHRDYKDLITKLPMLQKQERIFEISDDKQEYHMSDERLRDLEKKRQNKMDNAYTKLFAQRQPAIVTLPSKKPPEVLDSPPTLDVGSWDVDFGAPKMFTGEEVQTLLDAFNDKKPQDRKEKLKDLLRSLKQQKEQLIKEIKSLPEEDSLRQLINDKDSFEDEKKHKKDKRKRSPEESLSSSESTSETRTSRDKQGRSRKISDSAASPRKKPRKRSVLVLQNMSTQTTPKPVQEKQSESSLNEDKTVQTSISHPENICSKVHIPCDCNKNKVKGTTEELCQIVIKINDEEPSEVVVKQNKEEIRVPKQRESKEKTVEVQTTKSKEKHPSSKASVRIESSKSKISEKSQQTSKSWRDELSKNSLSTTSTSYMSPPDYSKSKQSAVGENSKDSSFYNLHKKPQQSNTKYESTPSDLSSFENRNIDPKLLNYIKKLLSMSRASIEDLTVSSSDVATPSQSVIEIETNNPLAQLQNIIKYFNLKVEDIAQELSLSPDTTPMTSRSENSQKYTVEPDLKSYNKSDVSSKSMIPERDGSSSSSLKIETSKEAVTSQYADITDSCSKRIASLAAMIQKLREEKEKMIESAASVSGSSSEERHVKSPAVFGEKDYSTVYLDLPDLPAVDSRGSSKDSSHYSLDEEELNRKLLEIDLSLANKLRKYSPGKKSKLQKPEDKTVVQDSRPETAENFSPDQQLLLRLQRLLRNTSDHQRTPPVSPQRAQSSTDDRLVEEMEYVPFLLNIPKLPKLEAGPESFVTQEKPSTSYQKRPPPSKGLFVARKFNDNISLVPHELSTIVEADSQTNVGLPSPSTVKFAPDQPQVTKEKPSSISSSPKSDVSLPDILTEVSIATQIKSCKDPRCKKNLSSKTSPDKSKSGSDRSSGKSPVALLVESTSETKSSRNSSSEKSYEKLCDPSVKKKKAPEKSGSSSTDDLETIEAMLKSIGMEWAIPTLHKTQEALALTSSSSSLDLSDKNKSKKLSDSSGSEISLKDFLKKQLLGKISSSTLRSEASPASLLEFSDLSAIQANSSSDKVKHRTSTPVVSSKSNSKSMKSKNIVFTGESDISSVKDNSNKSTDKYSFYSVSEQSQSKNGM